MRLSHPLFLEPFAAIASLVLESPILSGPASVVKTVKSQVKVSLPVFETVSVRVVICGGLLCVSLSEIGSTSIWGFPPPEPETATFLVVAPGEALEIFPEYV